MESSKKLRTECGFEHLAVGAHAMETEKVHVLKRLLCQNQQLLEGEWHFVCFNSYQIIRFSIFNGTVLLKDGYEVPE